MSHEEGFLRAILDTPDDDGPRLVYADWLAERGDARGEFIRLQCVAARTPADDPRRRALRAREEELLAAHAPDWCASLGLGTDECRFRRGFVEAVEIHADRFLERPEALFRAAPVREIHFLHATRHIREIADCPWLAKLATLDLSANAIEDPGAAALASSPHLTGLTTLDLGGCEVHQEGAESLARARSLSGLRGLCLAGCQIRPSGLQALFRSTALDGLKALDLRGNHQCWVSPNEGELWITLTETNVTNDGVRLLAESPEAARLESIDLSLNLVEASGWEALVNSPHLAGVRSLNVFESDHVYTDEAPDDTPAPASPSTMNEMISDVLCLSIPGGSRRPVGRQPGDPRWTAPPCTVDEAVARRLRERFGQRVTFTPPSVRFGAHFAGTREDWYGYRALLSPPAA
jgi:uncharacterized protein (TIGR02996 family)